MEKKYKLPKEFATKWLAALRSGEYQQAEGELYSSFQEGYCCLGVACVLSGLEQRQLVGLCIPDSVRELLPDSYPAELMEGDLITELISRNDAGMGGAV